MGEVLVWDSSCGSWSDNNLYSFSLPKSPMIDAKMVFISDITGTVEGFTDPILVDQRMGLMRLCSAFKIMAKLLVISSVLKE